jgi:hypothetical protein
LSNEQFYLRRYTDLPGLLYLLKTRSITLLDPKRWDDKNDSFYFSLYKKHRRLKSVLALCFTEASERYHFWHVFGARSSGVRIRFRRRELLETIKRQGGVQAGPVDYVTLEKIADLTPSIDRFPFLKRYGFQDEKEFRIIYESSTDKMSKLDIPIQLSCIDKIVLSPSLDAALFSQTRELLHTIDGCSQLRIVHSRLTNNETWKRAGKRVIRNAVRRSQ